MPTAAQVIASAKHYYESGRSIPPNMCLKIVRTIAGIGSGASTAANAYWAAESAGRTHENSNAPAGAFYYWTGGSSGAGHIAISAGNGYIYTTDYPRRGRVGLVKLSTLNKAWGNLTFRGWSDTVNGGRVTKLGKVPASSSVNAAKIAADMAKSSVKASSISKSDLAAGLTNAGYSQALIASSAELSRLYQKAIQQGWTADRFQGEVKNSKWYRDRSADMRAYDTLKKTDPKTFNHNLHETESALRTKAMGMGITISEDRLESLAKTVYRNGLLNGAFADPGVVQRLLAAEFEFGKTSTTTTVTPGKTTTTGMSEFDKLKKAIIGQESGGDYGAVGSRTAKGNYAYGKYQIMDFNIPSWTKKYLGHSLTPQQFLRDHAAQDKVAAGMLRTYYDKYGAAGAAAAWYSGEGGAKAYIRGGGINPAKGTVGPKTRDYVAQVLARMKKMKGGAASSTSGTSTTTTTTGPAPDYLPGDAGQYMDQIRDLAHSYGVAISDKTLGKQIQDILAGRNDIEGLTSYYRAQAVSRYPQFADQLKTGQTLEAIADPYIQQMATTLEMDPAKLDWSDPTVQRGLSQKDAKTGAPTSMTLWQFQDSLKKDARWKQTDNARNSLFQAGHQVLQDMGLVN